MTLHRLPSGPEIAILGFTLIGFATVAGIVAGGILRVISALLSPGAVTALQAGAPWLVGGVAIGMLAMGAIMVHLDDEAEVSER